MVLQSFEYPENVSGPRAPVPVWQITCAQYVAGWSQPDSLMILGTIVMSTGWRMELLNCYIVYLKLI